MEIMNSSLADVLVGIVKIGLEELKIGLIG
jgi:hypothetical protein